LVRGRESVVSCVVIERSESAILVAEQKSAGRRIEEIESKVA